jgi:hypothetical protein
MLKSGDYADIVAAYGFPPESDPLNIHVPLTEDDVFYQIKEARAPLIVPEVLERADWYQVEGLPQARVWMGTPLIDADDEVIGMLSLTRETPTSYSEDEVSLAQAFAGQAAVALQNARLYSDLSQAYDQLDRLDRTKSDFINVAAHELRTPLTVLRAFSQMMVKDPDIAEDPTKHHMANGMYENALRLHSIVDSMVDMARIDSRALKIHATKIPIPRLIHGVVNDLAEVFEKRNLAIEIDRAWAAGRLQCLEVGRARCGDCRERHGHRHRPRVPGSHLCQVLPDRRGGSALLRRDQIQGWGARPGPFDCQRDRRSAPGAHLGGKSRLRRGNKSGQRFPRRPACTAAPGGGRRVSYFPWRYIGL